ncbi:hypothetical protein L218DRAFT_1037261 [Marasmius fiardii PR-910]|nr:hypothetical protein L218DRAFT_1037261 [Marasmius fiardii PR-910]
MSQNAPTPGSLSVIDSSITPVNIVDKYWELKGRFQELEVKCKRISDDPQCSSESNDGIREERNSTLKALVELEKRPQILSLNKNGTARKRRGEFAHESGDQNARRSKRPCKNSEADGPYDELAVAAPLMDTSSSRSSSLSPQQALELPSGGDNSNITFKATTPRCSRGEEFLDDHVQASTATTIQDSDTSARPSSSSGPVIDSGPTHTPSTSGVKMTNSAPTTAPSSDPSSTAPAQPCTSSSMASNPYAAYLTSNNPYAYYYLHPHLPPGIHPGMAMSGIPPTGMYISYPPPLTSTSKSPVPIQSQQLSDPSRPSQTKPKRLKSHAVTTKSFNIPIVPRDSEGKPMLPLNVGIMTVMSLGGVCVREHFHTERYIFPVGYQVTRRYLSTQDKNREVVYHCTILDGGDGPKFQIVPSDAPDLTIIAGTATGAWSNIVRKANAIRNRQHSNSVSGPDFFGLGQNTIKHLIQQLPNADKLRDYVWQNFVEGGPLGGRHAAVVPALPEDYGASMAIGGFYGPGGHKAAQPPPNQVNSKHYPPYSNPPSSSGVQQSQWNASAGLPPAQSGQESIPIDPQLTPATAPPSDSSADTGQDNESSIINGDSAVAATIASIMSNLSPSDPSRPS